jgi:hypothetical protein
MSVDHRQEAQARVKALITLLQSASDLPDTRIIAECEALSNAIAAFHMEGIRFRIYNVDRLLRAGASASGPTPVAATGILEDARKHLEAAGFYTRSHQAPI